MSTSIPFVSPGFVSKQRSAPVDTVVVHESVSTNGQNTIADLRRRGLGVHFLIDENGAACQLHATTYSVAHAGVLNARSIGIEIVTPYYPPARAPWTQVIAAPWAHRGRYVIPTEDQLRVLWDVLDHVHDLIENIPRHWPGLVEGGISMGRVSGASRAPGIQAHGYTNHADGFFPVLYLWLRSVLGTHENAYTEAVHAAFGARGVARTSVHGEGEVPWRASSTSPPSSWWLRAVGWSRER